MEKILTSWRKDETRKICCFEQSPFSLFYKACFSGVNISPYYSKKLFGGE